MSPRMRAHTTLMAAALVLTACAPTPTAGAPSYAVGPQYDSVHVYVQPGQFDNFVRSWTATFGGTASKAGVAQVTPTPSSTRSQLILSPVGTLSVFEFLTPVPAPFGAERTGWLVTDMDAAVSRARDTGASVVVAPFNDPIGRDAVVQFPGGVNAQLYWHATAPSYPALQTVPENRAYVSADAVDKFLASYRDFTGATVTSDDPHADGELIGKPGTTFRQIRLGSGFGNTTVLVTDGQLPFPYGREVAGYAVADVPATVQAAVAAGAAALVPASADGSRAMLQFPGGYIAEVHTAAR